jgi:AcrR family transcriptional regulator
MFEHCHSPLIECDLRVLGRWASRQHASFDGPFAGRTFGTFCPETTMAAILNRRSDQTRGELMSAFTGLVFAKGFDNISVKEIIASAGIARSTFYEHFSNKEDILRACMTRFFATIADCAGANEMPTDLIEVLDHLWTNRRLTDAIFSGHARTVLARNQADLLEQRLRVMSPLLRLPHRLAAIEIADAQLGLVESWLRGRAPCSVENLADGLFRSSRASALALSA